MGFCPISSNLSTALMEFTFPTQRYFNPISLRFHVDSAERFIDHRLISIECFYLLMTKDNNFCVECF